MGKSLVIKTQTSREDCANYVKSNYKDVDYGRIGKLRNSKCYNKTSRGGVSIGLYSPKSILSYEENGKFYCFTPEDIRKIIKHKPHINPYTGKNITFSQEQKKEIYNKLNSVNQPLNIDLIQLNENRLCPLFFSQHRNIGFIALPHSEKPIELETMSEYFPVDYIEVSMHLSPINDKTPVDIYKVRLTDKLLDNLHPTRKNLVNVDDIVKLTRVYNSANDEIINVPEPLQTGNKEIFLSDKLISKLQLFISDEKETINIFSNDELKELKKANFSSEKNLTLCKGIDIDKVDNLSNIKIGDKITINFQDITLWSTNICTELAKAMKYRYGAVIISDVSPEKVLIDLRYSPKLNSKNLILVPCTLVVKIYFITEENSYCNIKKPISQNLIQIPSERTHSKPDIFEIVVAKINSIFRT